MATTRVYARSDFSMGLQNASSWLMRKMNELDDGRNLRFNEDIGAIVRRNGYTLTNDENRFTSTNKTPVGFHTAQFSTGARFLVAVPNDGNTFTLVRAQNLDGTWTTVISDIPIGADVHFVDFRDEVIVSGYTTADDVPFAPYSIDKTLNVSQTRNLLNVPLAKYYTSYKNVLYAVNTLVGGTRYTDRFYKASAPTGAVTFIRGNQTDSQVALTYINQVPKMTSATAPAGTAAHSSSQATWEGYKIFKQDNTRTGGSWFTPGGTGTGWVSYDFASGNAKVITHYMVRALAASGVGTDDPGGAPKDWTLQGSNNGSTWTDIHAVTGAAAWANGEERTYATTNTTSYQYYRINVTLVQGGGGTVWVTLNGLKLYTTIQSQRPLQLKLDSVRYIKTGMSLDIYKSGKTQKLYDITVYDVDKPTNTIQFLPDSFTISAVSTGSDTITITDTTKFPTGTPILFTSSSTLPAPLAANTTYYAVNVNSTTLKLATSLDNATIGQVIDITSTGGAGGTHAVFLSYVLTNNDEVWLDGRFGTLTTLWNTDYPTPDKADWSAVQTGSDSNNAITGAKEAGNRLFIFTLNTTTKFDGNSPMLASRSIGCATHRSIQSLDDDWLVWLTARGRIYARNEAAGQQEYISRGISNKLLSNIPLSQLKTASAGSTDNEYFLYLGDYNGEKTRVLYDFGSNTWSVDVINNPSYMYANNSASGSIGMYFVGDNGKLYLDDSGDNDDGVAIRFEAALGKNNYGTTNDKLYTGMYIYSENAIGLKVEVQIDNDAPMLVGEIKNSYGQLDYPADNKDLFTGSVCSVKILGAINGPAQKIFALNDIYTMVQEINGHGQKQ